MIKGLCLVLFAFVASQAHAVLPVFDLDVFYFSDSMVYNSSTSTYQRTFYDFMLGMPLSSKGTWVLGWNYDSYSFTDNPGTATTLTISDMGPKLLVSLSKDKTVVFGFSYNLITKGSYNPGTTASELRGTSMRAELGYLPQVTENFFLGVKMNYYKASFTEEVINQTTLSHVTDSRTAIYPSLSMTYRF
jgi:hypothetical protein